MHLVGLKGYLDAHLYRLLIITKCVNMEVEHLFNISDFVSSGVKMNWDFIQKVNSLIYRHRFNRQLYNIKKGKKLGILN